MNWTERDRILAARISASGKTLLHGQMSIVMAKRRLLVSALRLSGSTSPADLHDYRSRLRAEAHEAQSKYVATVLKWGSRSNTPYRAAARRQFLGLADELGQSLIETMEGLPPDDRYEAATEVQMLEEFIESERREQPTSVRTQRLATQGT